MKTPNILVGLFLLGATLGLSQVPAQAAEDMAMSKVEISPGYCHMKFPAIQEDSFGRTLVLKDAATSDIIDFYGPCDYDSLGRVELSAQKFDEQLDYEGESP